MSVPPLDILIFTPAAFPSPTGNAVTVERWRSGLAKRGHNVKVLVVAGFARDEFRREVEAFRPQVLHVHQLLRAGRHVIDEECRPLYGQTALFLSPAGTDVYGEDGRGCDPRDRKLIHTLFRLARGIVVQSPHMASRLEEIVPSAAAKTRLIPKAVHWSGDDPYDVREACGWGPREMVFFMPAGVRPVKGNLLCLRAFRRVHALRPHVRLCFAGPVLDEIYGVSFAEELARCGAFARLLPPIDRQRMRRAYQSIDVVVNASLAEGLSNALLEAVAASRPVLASDIPGNRGAPVRGGILFFHPGEEKHLISQALRLVDDQELRMQLSLNAALTGPVDEATLLAGFYHEGLTAGD